MAPVPDTKYATTLDDLRIAYQTVGDGPIDIAFLGHWFGNVEIQWEIPEFERQLRRLASFGRLITFDKRGTGLSDPVPLANLPTLEEWIDDLRAVLDAVGSDRAVIVAGSLAALMAGLFAATHPSRTAALVLVAPLSAGLTAEVADAIAVAGSAVWGTGAMLGSFRVKLATDPGFQRRYARYERHSISPGGYRAILAALFQADVRYLLPTIAVPTLVVYHEDSGFSDGHHDVARHLTGATHVVLAGTAPEPIFGGDEVLDEIEQFLTGARRGPDTDRVLTTVMFTDIVASTERATELGDRAWRAVLDRHRAHVREQLQRFRGREINTRGDDFLATFDGPARAIRCALAITSGAAQLGLEVRSGLHTGEVELMDDDLGGIAVHIGARVCEIAAAGEVLVSRTVVDLVAGSGIEVEDRGEHELKGVPGTWRLFAVAS